MWAEACGGKVWEHPFAQTILHYLLAPTLEYFIIKTSMQTIEDYVNAYGRKSREEFIRDVPSPLLVYRGAVVATEPDRAFRTTTMTPKEVQRLANAVSTTAVLRV